jgi:hypothetical protein
MMEVINVALAGTAVQLSACACGKVYIKALEANAGTIYVGWKGVSSALYGAALLKGESIYVDCINANMIWLDGSVADQKASVMIMPKVR